MASGQFPRIIMNEEVLSDHYVPPRLLHREKELLELKRRILDGIENERNTITIVWGPPGVGKTAIMKRLLMDLSTELEGNFLVKYFDGISSSCNTIGKVLRSLLRSIWPSSSLKGISDALVTSLLINAVKTKDIKLIIGIDEAHNALLRDHGILKTILTSKGTEGMFQIVLATIEGQWVYPYLDMRGVADSKSIELGLYDREALYAIISDRAHSALRPGSYDDETLEYMAELSSNEGTARYAIQLLKTSAEIAEEMGHDVIRPEDIRKASTIVPGSISLSKILALDLYGKITLYAAYRALRNKVFVTISDIYNELIQVLEEIKIETGKELQVPARVTIHIRLQGASRMKLILSKDIMIGSKKITRYYVDFPTEGLLEKIRESIINSLD
ncbi:MAG: hypothetical protein DRN30_06370 [Thermoplasmata archaeon]|nr:MAG: hypothetical protein DRN30_06370 [Thermoplasmata archaeon]